MSPADVLKLIKEKGVKFVDLRFTDTRGKEQHVTVPHHAIDAGVFGAPSYVLPSGEFFWGQDRLELLERALKMLRQPQAAAR